jgi:hypothetical protein
MAEVFQSFFNRVQRMMVADALSILNAPPIVANLNAPS